MQKYIKELEQEVATLQSELESKQNTIDDLKKLSKYYRDKFRHLARQLSGANSLNTH